MERSHVYGGKPIGISHLPVELVSMVFSFASEAKPSIRRVCRPHEGPYDKGKTLILYARIFQ